MINRQNIWFLSLFSLILILGVYYITLPSEIFSDNKVLEVSKEIEVEVSESDKLVSLRVERNEALETKMNELQKVITSQTTTAEDKNKAFNNLQELNLTKGKETYLEDKILEKFKIKSFVEINNDNIKITIASSEHNTSLANNIMRSIQEEFTEKKNITIKFEN